MCEMHKNMAFILSKFHRGKNRLCIKSADYADFYQRGNDVIGYSYKIRNGNIQREDQKKSFTRMKNSLGEKGEQNDSMAY